MQGLSQVVACCGEEAGFRQTCALGFLCPCAQRQRGLIDAAAHECASVGKSCSHFVHAFGQGAQTASAAGGHALIKLAAADALYRVGNRTDWSADAATHAPCQQQAAERDDQHPARSDAQQFSMTGTQALE